MCGLLPRVVRVLETCPRRPKASPGPAAEGGTQWHFGVCGTGRWSWTSRLSLFLQCFRVQGQAPQDRVKWSEAQFSCEQQEAQLVTIANPLEQGRAGPWGGPSILGPSPPKWLVQSEQGLPVHS